MSEGQNPFAPPSTEWERGADAGFVGFVADVSQGTRFVNFLIDSVCRFGLIIGATLVFGDHPVVTLTLIVGYYVIFEAIFQRTPAKWITRTRVVAFDGSKPSFAQILGRSLARFVPFEPFSFFFDVRGWHDKWSSTRVVRDDGRAP